MLKNYIKIAWRNLLKSRVYSFINIFGLALGMAVSMLIAIWLWDEVSFDSYHQNNSTVAQVWVTQTFDGHTGTNQAMPVPVANALRTNFKDDFKKVALTTWVNNLFIKYHNKTVQSRGVWVQPDFKDIFSIKVTKGNANALTDPSSMLIAQSLVKAVFGKANPIGQTLRLDNEINLKVAGVYEDLPANTTMFDVKALLPSVAFENEPFMKTAKEDWGNHSYQIFVQLHDGKSFEQVSKKIKDIIKPHFKEGNDEVLLHPMSKWHLYSEFTNGKVSGGRIRYVWLFGVIGAFVLLLACINFMNLSTARSEKRAKEVGVRKAIGSMRGQLIRQFLAESLMMSFCASVLAIALVYAFLPFFNTLSNKQLVMPWLNVYAWVCVIAFVLFTGLIAGSYPAFYLSAFKPVSVLKGTFKAGKYAALPRRILVTVQFTVSVILIIGTLVVFKQIKHAMARPVGYTREGLISVNINSPDLRGHYDAVREQVLQTGVVENMCESASPTTEIYSNQIGFEWEGKPAGTNPIFGVIAITHDFGKTIDWTIKQGRDFSREFKTDSAGLILNEEAAKLMGFKNPVGQTVRYNGKPMQVVGVIKNMVVQSPYVSPQPNIYMINYGWTNILTVRVKPGVATQTALKKLEPLFKRLNPEAPFDYRFVDDQYAAKFANEQRIGNLATFFAILAIAISSLGLFGLASFVAEQRTKEVGVRKVLGASVYNLWSLLSKDFVMLVLISCLIAIPVAWYFLSSWLQAYEYRTTISWWIFGIAGVGAMVVTLLTVSYQAIRAAIANPVKSLRTE